VTHVRGTGQSVEVVTGMRLLPDCRQTGSNPNGDRQGSIPTSLSAKWLLGRDAQLLNGRQFRAGPPLRPSCLLGQCDPFPSRRRHPSRFGTRRSNNSHAHATPNNLLWTANTPFGTLIGAVGLCSETLRLADSQSSNAKASTAEAMTLWYVSRVGNCLGHSALLYVGAKWTCD